jgi:predicted flap endonuclease-1-like 5' DNA nuclease
MRSDVTLYIVAIIFFTLAFTSFLIFTNAEQQMIWAIFTAVLGVISASLGLRLRPKVRKTIKTIQLTPPAEEAMQLTANESAPVIEEPIAETVPLESTLIEEAALEENPLEELSPPESIPTEDLQTVETSVETEYTLETPVLPSEETLAITPQNDEASALVEQEEVSLTSVKGIGEKRAAQLYALGIKTVKELAQTSVEDLAKNLKISPKIAAKLIEAAKQQ